jgi:SpoVK/Ycf46/Vps4 family AAA+-type ATPase
MNDPKNFSVQELYEKMIRQESVRLRVPPQFINPEGIGRTAAGRDKVERFILQYNHEVAWDDVIGNDRAREALLEAIEAPTKHRALYEFYGMKPLKGVMLYGPPGCGKTMFAKAAASAISRIHGTKAECLVVNGPEINSKWWGETEENLRNIFTYARNYAKLHNHPLVVFFDEADTLFPDRNRGGTFRPNEATIAQMLTELDGMNELGAFVILATNRPEVMDEALLRDGRIDLKIKVERPTKVAAAQILYKVLEDIPSETRLDDLVFAAVEAFHDPAYVIHEGRILIGENNEIVKDIAQNFCLEHVINGAMLTGIAGRAKSRAFKRDLVSGSQTGVKVQDILDAIREVYEETKLMNHQYAIQEFVEKLRPMAEALAEQPKKKGNLQ